MKLMIWLLFLAWSPLFADEKWPRIAFTEVRAYAWPESKQTETVILPDKTLAPGVINGNGTLLSAKEVTQLRAAVTGTHSGYPSSACYVPHNAFVLYDSSNKPVAFLEICFSCLGHRALPETAHNLDLLSLAAIFAEHGLPMGEYRDFQSFKEAWIATMKQKTLESEMDTKKP
jgi:hypothetical protein